MPGVSRCRRANDASQCTACEVDYTCGKCGEVNCSPCYHRHVCIKDVVTPQIAKDQSLVIDGSKTSLRDATADLDSDVRTDSTAKSSMVKSTPAEVDGYHASDLRLTAEQQQLIANKPFPPWGRSARQTEL